MLSFALRIILLLLFIGGIIAYIGNYVGRIIGKRRLTIFSLRPRYTATAITVISGILIALSTLAVLLVVSQDARTALLGLEKLKGQIAQKSRELAEANKSLAELNRTLEDKLRQQAELERNLKSAKEQIAELERLQDKLGREVKIAREGQVLFRVGEIVTQSLIQAGPEKAKLESGLKQILSAADSYIRSLGVKSEKHLIFMAPEDFDQTVSLLLADNKIYIVKLVATRNALWGEEIPARFELAENKLIYREGKEIADLDIPAGFSAPVIEQEIMRLLGISHRIARGAGVLSDPMGSMGSIPYAQIFELAKRIKVNNREVNLKALAARDVYTIGPLEVKFKISYK